MLRNSRQNIKRELEGDRVRAASAAAGVDTQTAILKALLKHENIAKTAIIQYHDCMSITATKAKDQFSNLLERVRVTSERIVIEKHGKPAAVLVSVADLERLQRLDALEQAAPHQPLAGTVRRFDDPFEPIAASDWHAAQ